MLVAFKQIDGMAWLQASRRRRLAYYIVAGLPAGYGMAWHGLPTDCPQACPQGYGKARARHGLPCSTWLAAGAGKGKARLQQIARRQAYRLTADKGKACVS